MSGDVQPRKRREKKKKKEDGTEDVVFQHQQTTPITTSPIVTDDLNIHIQKEASTGGGLCAKFVFFILLTALTTLIGLIITEHRGLTDIDAIDTESRFAQLFEGWIDAPSVDHESGEELSLEQSEEHASEEEEDHDEEEDDDDEHDQSLDHDDDDDEEEDEEASDEQATDENATDEENYEEEKEESELQEDTIENESEEVSNEVDDENEDEVDEDEVDEQEEDEEEDEEQDQEYESEDEEISRDASSLPTKEEVTQEEEDESQEDKDESQEDRDEPEDSEEALDKTIETEESKGTVESEETADLTESEEAVDETPDQTESEEAVDHAESEEALSLDETEEVSTKHTDEEDTIEKIDDAPKPLKPDGESKEPVTKVRLPKTEKKKSVEVSEDTDQPQENDNYNMAIKFGVGTALLVVAHVVLVQKWRTEEKIVTKKPQDGPAEAETVTPDLSRRNTIVTPPSLQEIEQDIENVEEEYSEDDEDYDSDDDSRSKPTSAKMRYQELQSNYSHTLSPDWEPKEVRENRDKNCEEEEEEIEGEEGDGEEGDEEYDDEISENEDEELLKRLEQKYGCIRHSDEEPDDVADDDGNDEEEEEEEDDEEEEEDRDDDFDSWKRVKVPSGNVPEDSDSENEKDWSKQRSGAQAVYDFENITNSDDWQVREELDRAQQNLANDVAYALTLFNKVLERNPSSPRALYGKAQSLDILAEEKKSNNLLQQAIVYYQQVLQIKEVPDALFQIAAERCIDRMRFRGLYSQAVPIHKLLIEKFPKEPKFANHLAVTYLTTNKINDARKLLHETLLKWPNDGFALVHYGFILKTNDNDLERAIEFLQKGIETKEPGVIDGRFYFHLGDALTRLGRKDEAMTIYLDGVTNKVFLSKYQRSLYNVERLTGKPWWGKEQTPYLRFFEQLENNWKVIRDEGLSILNQKGYFQPESENLRDVGDWKQFELYARGIKNSKNCKQCPITCKIVETIPDAIGCRRGQIKFSVMHPGTHVWPHCGPTNCRLRTHLGLKVPLNTYIRVGKEIRSWEEGKLLIFDDSFEHEVWHNGTDTRLVLIIDIWHPELTRREKQSLSSI